MACSTRWAVLVLVAGCLAGQAAVATGQGSRPPSDGRGERIFLALYSVDEIALTGITKTPKGSIAVLEVVDPEGPYRPLPPPRPLTFFAKVGDRLYDARIVEIGASTVTVEQCALPVPCDAQAKKGRKPVRKILKLGKGR